MLLDRPRLADSEVFHILSSPRRRATLRYLDSTSEAVPVADLADAIAAAETGQSPPPTDARQAVYVSLHQTHLPALHERGVIRYDREHKRVIPQRKVREVGRYMNLDAAFGVSWAELYRGLGLLGLVAVVAASADLPLVSAVDSLVWATLFLALFAVTSASHLWRHRGSVRRQLR